MHINTKRELYLFMTPHLRAGITPPQFEMDGLRLHEMRLSAMRMAVAASDKSLPNIDVRSTRLGKLLAYIVIHLRQLSIRWPSPKLLRS